MGTSDVCKYVALNNGRLVLVDGDPRQYIFDERQIGSLSCTDAAREIIRQLIGLTDADHANIRMEHMRVIAIPVIALGVEEES